MATMYKTDVLAPARWGGVPDLVLSGPNEGQNVRPIVNSSGTVGNAQFALSRGLPAIALSAGSNTVDNVTLADPDSTIVADLTLKLLRELEARAWPGRRLLPEGLSLNVNFPTAVTPDVEFAPSRIGTFQLYNLMFRNTIPWPDCLVQRSEHGDALAGRRRGRGQRHQGLGDPYAGELRPESDRAALAAVAPAPPVPLGVGHFRPGLVTRPGGSAAESRCGLARSRNTIPACPLSPPSPVSPRPPRS